VRNIVKLSSLFLIIRLGEIRLHFRPLQNKKKSSKLPQSSCDKRTQNLLKFDRDSFGSVSLPLSLPPFFDSTWGEYAVVIQWFQGSSVALVRA
jgi:hypothetical protein